MNILLIAILIVALLIYIVYGFMYWLITTLLVKAIFTNDMETIKKFKPQLYKSRRLMFLARVKGDSVNIHVNPLWVLVYPFFYYFGWNVLMYSYVYGEKEISQYLEDVGVDTNRKDIYGKDAAMLRALAETGVFKNYKYAEIMKNIDKKIMRGDFDKYDRPGRRVFKKK